MTIVLCFSFHMGVSQKKVSAPKYCHGADDEPGVELGDPQHVEAHPCCAVVCVGTWPRPLGWPLGRPEENGHRFIILHHSDIQVDHGTLVIR